MAAVHVETFSIKGDVYHLELHDRVRRSGFEPLVLETTIDLIRKGYITTINHEPDHWVLGLMDDNGEPAAYIVFEPRNSQGLAHVILGGTVERLRKSGVYTELFRRLAEIIRIYPRHTGPTEAFRGITKITGCYHVDNESARIMNEKLGRKPVRVTTEYQL